MLALSLFFVVAFTTTPDEQTAHDNMCTPFEDLGGCTIGKPPCEEVWTVCENGKVVALNLAGKLELAFPDISGFSQLRNLSFLDGTEISPTQSLATFSLLSNLRHFSVGPAVLAVEWESSALPATIGTDWPNLEVFILHHVKEFPQLPASVTSWSRLRIFNLIQVNDLPPFPVFALPLSLNSWTSIEEFLIWDSFVNPAQQIPTLGTKANLTEFDLRDTVSDMTTMLPFTLFSDDALFDSQNLRDFALVNIPNCAGTFPDTFGHATSLVNFEITQTSMNGGMPTNIGNLKNLEKMSLQGAFTGILPSTIGGWKSAREIILEDVRVSGTIPTQIGNLHELSSLIISGTAPFPKLSGTFPKELASLAYRNLSELAIAVTDMIGKIPEPDFKAPPSKITFLALSQNGFQCTLPDWIIETIPSIEIGFCVIGQNNFCQLPLPLQQADMTKCSYATSHEPCLCGECEQGERPQTCEDCNGIVAGSDSYDACDVCGGDSLSCVDCNGVPNGSSTYDLCDICGGTNSCADCSGSAPGASVYDQCDVCNGDGTSCLDCLGTPHGTHTYDSCDVCGGDNLSCHDCNNGTSGEFEFDLCGNCANMTIPGYMPDCFDCAGTPNGSQIIDLCGVCNGTNTDCNPNEIGAGVVGLRVVIPCLIIFAALDVIFLVVYMFLRRNSSATLVPDTRSRYVFTVPHKQPQYPMSKFVN